MTRPMPEPPQWIESSSLSDWDDAGRWRYRWDLHWEDGRAEFDVLERHDKRLTDAECAAEYWRAEMEAADARGRSWFYEDPATVNAERVKASRAANRARTWRRFATRPHALEEA